MYYKNSKELLAKRVIERFRDYNYFSVHIPHVDALIYAFFGKDAFDIEMLHDPSIKTAQKHQLADYVIKFTDTDMKILKNRSTDVDLILFLLGEDPDFDQKKKKTK